MHQISSIKLGKPNKSGVPSALKATIIIPGIGLQFFIRTGISEGTFGCVTRLVCCTFCLSACFHHCLLGLPNVGIDAPRSRPCPLLVPKNVRAGGYAAMRRETVSSLRSHQDLSFGEVRGFGRLAIRY